MEMKFVNNQSAETDMEYLMQMVGHTHDLSHIISGFETEHGRRASQCADGPDRVLPIFQPGSGAGDQLHDGLRVQYPASRAPSSIIPALSISCLKATRRGIEAGQGLKIPVFMIDYEHYFDWQMDDIAADLGFVRGPEDEWAYTEQLCAG